MILPCLIWQNFPKPLLPLWGNPYILSQQVQLIFGFYFIYFFPQNKSVHYFEPRWFAKQVPKCLWFLVSTQLLWIVLGTHNLELSRSTLLLFKISKFHPSQVWTRFVKFGEIHISTSPKIPPKFRQPLAAMRGHSTKNQLKEKSPHAKIILSNTWLALLLCIFRKFRVSVSFLRQCSVRCQLCV